MDARQEPGTGGDGVVVGGDGDVDGLRAFVNWNGPLKGSSWTPGVTEVATKVVTKTDVDACCMDPVSVACITI